MEICTQKSAVQTRRFPVSTEYKHRLVVHSILYSQNFFPLFDVAQVLKHMLALARNLGRKGSLCYLWFEMPGNLADQHRCATKLALAVPIFPWHMAQLQIKRNIRKQFSAGCGRKQLLTGGKFE
jgi:hypothetical protein